MYFKENWKSMAEKEPTFGHVDMFQTSPNKAQIKVRRPLSDGNNAPKWPGAAPGCQKNSCTSIPCVRP